MVWAVKIHSNHSNQRLVYASADVAHVPNKAFHLLFNPLHASHSLKVVSLVELVVVGVVWLFVELVLSLKVQHVLGDRHKTRLVRRVRLVYHLRIQGANVRSDDCELLINVAHFFLADLARVRSSRTAERLENRPGGEASPAYDSDHLVIKAVQVCSPLKLETYALPAINFELSDHELICLDNKLLWVQVRLCLRIRLEIVERFEVLPGIVLKQIRLELINGRSGVERLARALQTVIQVRDVLVSEPRPVVY